MEDNSETCDHLRRYSLPPNVSRFPSLRRSEVGGELHSPRSSPYTVATSASLTPDLATTLVPLEDEKTLHIGHHDDDGSVSSAQRSNQSNDTLSPSLKTKNSSINSGHQFRQPNLVDDQTSNDSIHAVSRHCAISQESTTMNKSSTEKQLLATKSYENNNRLGDTAHDSRGTCDGGHGTLHGAKEATKVDVEAQNILQTPTTFGGREKTGNSGDDEFNVNFNGPDDPLNPKNWPSRKKWATTACIAAFTFMSPLASTMIAPALPQIAGDFGIVDPVETQIVLSIFVLAFAVGPMVLGPLSELYGRVTVSQGSNILFLVFNTACGFAQTKQQLMAFRFLSGLGGSAPLAIGGGVLGDIFEPEERGKAMGLYGMGPLLGPAVGPIVGGWVAQKSTWRWMFWSSSVVNIIILICGFIWFHESYAPYLLHKKAKKMREDTGKQNYHAEGEGEVNQPIWRKITKTMGRAFHMLFTEPIVQVMSLYMGFSYGILYLMLSTFPILFMQQYNESVGIAGLNYISIGLGFFIGAPICGRSSDIVYQKLKNRDPQQQGRPENRMPLIIPFSCLVPVGLLIYGWSAQARTHWIVPTIGPFIIGIGTIAAFQRVTTYLVDTYMRFAASAIAAVTILRSLMGFGFPLFAPYMYRALGYGWGNSVLAIAALGIGVPVPILLWIFGGKLRAKSSIAKNAKPARGPGAPKAHDPVSPSKAAPPLGTAATVQQPL